MAPPPKPKPNPHIQNFLANLDRAEGPMGRPTPGGFVSHPVTPPPYDTDAQAYFEAVEAASGSFDLTGINATYTDTYVKQAHSEFYTGLKTDGVWDKLTEFYLLAGKTFDGLTVKGKGTGTLTNNNFVTGDWLAAGSGAGLTGNGSSKYLDTGLTRPASGDVGLSAYLTAANTDATSAFYIGAGVGGADFTALGRVSSGLSDGFNDAGDSTGYTITTNASRDGFFIGTSRSVTDRELYRNASSIATDTGAVTATADTTSALYVFSKSGSSDESNATLTFAHIGTGLTDTEASNLSTRVNTLMTALGCNTY
jgi:hypothetical protein